MELQAAARFATGDWPSPRLSAPFMGKDAILAHNLTHARQGDILTD